MTGLDSRVSLDESSSCSSDRSDRFSTANLPFQFGTPPEWRTSARPQRASSLDSKLSISWQESGKPSNETIFGGIQPRIEPRQREVPRPEPFPLLAEVINGKLHQKSQLGMVHKETEVDVPDVDETHGNHQPHATQSKSRGEDNGCIPVSEGPITEMEYVNQIVERRQSRLRKRIFELRTSALQSRLKVHEFRNNLRHQRELATDADAKLMKALNVYFATTSMPEEARDIMKLYEESRKARDVYQPLEDNYNQLENQLDREDFELMETEEKINQQETGLQNAQSEFSETALLDDSEKSFSTTTISHYEQYPPLVAQYLSLRGDVDLTQERLQALRTARAELVEEEKARKPFSLSLDLVDREFLSNFNSEHERLQRELAATEAEAEALRQRAICEDQGLLDPDPSSAEMHGPNDLTLGLFDVHLKDPLLIPESRESERYIEILRGVSDNAPSVQRSEFSNFLESNNNIGSEPISKTGYVNIWLLHILRRSGLEISRLKSTNRLQDLDVGQEELKNLVLEYWSKDDASKSPDMHPRYGSHSHNFQSSAKSLSEGLRAGHVRKGALRAYVSV